PQSFIVSEPENLVLNQRSAKRSPELISLADRFWRAEGIGEEVVGVQRIIPEKFVDAPTNGIGLRPDGCIHDGARTATKFSGRCIGLNPELLKRLNGWLNDLNVFTSVRTRI